MGRLLSVNVGLPRDVEWRGRTVHTGIWKEPVGGRCRVRRLNLEGDGQGDTAGHGGEQRAVFVYQIESYRHWEEHLKRADFVYGQFGENFTIEGLPDDVGVHRRSDALTSLGVAPQHIHREIFQGGESSTPGVVGEARRGPHLPEGDADTGPLVSFARSGIAAHWNASAHRSLLELAEACDVPVRWSCRVGVCHSCESDLVSGAVAYGPEPLDMPADGNVLVCCSQPLRDVVIDL